MGVEAVGEAVMVGEAAVTDWAGEAEATLLSGVVMHLADSQGVASVRDSGRCDYSPLLDFLFAKIMAISGIGTLGTTGISEMTTNAIMAISSTHEPNGLSGPDLTAIDTPEPIRINDEIIIEGEWGVIEEITLNIHSYRDKVAQMS